MSDTYEKVKEDEESEGRGPVLYKYTESCSAFCNRSIDCFFSFLVPVNPRMIVYYSQAQAVRGDHPRGGGDDECGRALGWPPHARAHDVVPPVNVRTFTGETPDFA